MCCLKVITSLMVLSLIICKSGADRGRRALKKEDVELERQLKILNKPPINTFQVT
ncbi:N-acylneuraminate-9-phosphatase [Ranunculus cassubicifolius]